MSFSFPFTFKGKDDIFAPYRVTDLRGYTIKENATAVLTFTASGDDVFEGTGIYIIYLNNY